MQTIKFVLALGSFLASSMFLSGQDQILGSWQAPDLENATIRVYQADDGQYYGKITTCDEADWVGQVILRELVYAPSEQTWIGTIYSPARKITIAGTLSLLSPNRLKIVGRKWMITKTFYWSR